MEISTPQTMNAPVCFMAYTNVTISVQNNRVLGSFKIHMQFVFCRKGPVRQFLRKVKLLAFSSSSRP
jgi:hypothetical protein